MEYVYTSDCIDYLLHKIPFVTRPQLQVFFRGSLEPKELSGLIEQMLRDHKIIEQEQYDTYNVLSVIRQFRVARSAMKSFHDAFWVIAWMGAENIRYIGTCNDNTRYLVMLEDSNELWDVTVCNTAEDARLGYANRDIKGNDDIINHIAFVYSESIANEMKDKLIAYGYDTVAVFDERTNRVKYMSLGEA